MRALPIFDGAVSRAHFLEIAKDCLGYYAIVSEPKSHV